LAKLEGLYCLRYANGEGMRIYECIGENPTEALNVLRRRQLAATEPGGKTAFRF